ncbi:F-box protein CPR1-like [Papaver somniferum]|uniref:F-box protein CPR1-like n=1 Tax=Papaver somniferum TaxID=3469 RepID=UPI000E6FE241|nr:F-box protein CPR1-like [Papaver somniferum]
MGIRKDKRVRQNISEFLIPLSLPKERYEKRQNVDFAKGVVVRFLATTVNPQGTEDGYVVEMYTLGSDSWRSIDTIPYMFSSAHYDSISGVLVNGARHWLGACRRLAQEFIVSLDFCEERLERLHLPEQLLEIEHWPINLGVLEECLCLFAYVNIPCDQMEIWVMVDYGVQESWTKHLVIRHQLFLELVSWRVIVIWSFADGKILIAS